MFLIRQAGPADYAGVFALARLLNSYNLPADPTYVRKLLALSRDSFAGRAPRTQAKYLFVLEEQFHRSHKRLVGCSLIMGKHGTPGSPHLWFSLDTLKKRSRTLGIARSHQVLRLGFTEDGPTEVGGLIVLPGYRRHPDRCGLQISFVRFLYMAMNPRRFEPQVLVEYRGAMSIGGKTPFWENVGKVFTGLSYAKADRLSVDNKEFIVSLLPADPIYCALLPTAVQQAIGAIHPAAERAAKLLQGIGFQRLPQIEPFDGGPYYLAQRSKIKLVQSTRRMKAKLFAGPRLRGSHFFMVGTEKGGTFRAVIARAGLKGNQLALGREELKLLGVEPGDLLYACPISR